MGFGFVLLEELSLVAMVRARGYKKTMNGIERERGSIREREDS